MPQAPVPPAISSLERAAGPSPIDAAYTPTSHSGARRWRRTFTIAVAVLSTSTMLGGMALADGPTKAGRPIAELPPAKSKADRADKGDKADKEPSSEERAARGVVSIERGGQPLALGAVLGGDGRILTALSPLGAGNDLDVRFADGSTVKAKLGHHDRMWDLALLVPQTGRWPDGLVAGSRNPVREDATIRSFSLNKGKIAAVPLVLRAYKTLLGADDKRLDKAIELGSRVLPGDLGAPALDEEGRVVGILARGCAPQEGGKPCVPVAFAVPTSAIRSFLKTVPASAVPPAAWLGIQGAPEVTSVVKGVRVLMVHPESPADEAKLRGGDKSIADVIVAVDGTPVTSPESLADVVRKHAVGEKVPVLLFGQGRYRQVNVLLRGAPGATPSAEAAPPAELPALPRAHGKRKGGEGRSADPRTNDSPE